MFSSTPGPPNCKACELTSKSLQRSFPRRPPASLSPQPEPMPSSHVLLVPHPDVAHVLFLRLPVLHQRHVSVSLPRLAALVVPERGVADKDHEAGGEHAEEDDGAARDAGHAGRVRGLVVD